jgi:hypothetical protein
MSADDACELTVAGFKQFLNQRGGANVASLVIPFLIWDLTVDDIVCGNFEERAANCLIVLSGKLHWASNLPILKIDQCYLFAQHADGPGKFWLCDCAYLLKEWRPERVDFALSLQLSAGMVKDLETGKCAFAGEDGQETKCFEMNVRYQNGIAKDEDAFYTYEIADSHGVLVFHAKDAVGGDDDEMSDGEF